MGGALIAISNLSALSNFTSNDSFTLRSYLLDAYYSDQEVQDLYS